MLLCKLSVNFSSFEIYPPIHFFLVLLRLSYTFILGDVSASLSKPQVSTLARPQNYSPVTNEKVQTAHDRTPGVLAAGILMKQQKSTCIYFP